VASILENLSQNHDSITTRIFRSTVFDVCAKFFAKYLPFGMRADIETEILKKMKINIEKQADSIDLIAVFSCQEA
jgi:prohibitin 1